MFFSIPKFTIIVFFQWKKLSDEEKAKYHKMAHLERVNHKQNYPDWSHSENYGIHKRHKRKYVKKDGLTEKTKNKSSLAKL